jgi:hypothetical protein
MEIRFELRDFRPSGRWSSKRTSLRRIAPIVPFREVRRPVTPRHRISVLHGKPKYVACLPSGLSRIGEIRLDGWEVCKPHQIGSVPEFSAIGHSPALAYCPVA